MNQTVSVYGLVIAVTFYCLNRAVPIVPKSIAWSGVAAGFIILLVGTSMPQLNITVWVAALFLVGALIMGGAVHLALKPAAAEIAVPSPPLPPSPANNMGDIKDNSGVITQDQKGDNILKR